MKNKKSKNNIFNEQDIDFVRELVDKNLPILFGQEISLDNDEKIFEIKKIINNLQNPETKKLFDTFEDLLRKSISYQNCLAYYIGLKKGVELNLMK